MREGLHIGKYGMFLHVHLDGKNLDVEDSCEGEVIKHKTILGTLQLKIDQVKINKSHPKIKLRPGNQAVDFQVSIVK